MSLVQICKLFDLKLRLRRFISAWQKTFYRLDPCGEQRSSAKILLLPRDIMTALLSSICAISLETDTTAWIIICTILVTTEIKSFQFFYLKNSTAARVLFFTWSSYIWVIPEIWQYFMHNFCSSATYLAKGFSVWGPSGKQWPRDMEKVKM